MTLTSRQARPRQATWALVSLNIDGSDEVVYGSRAGPRAVVKP
jgi:hypothetical protein